MNERSIFAAALDISDPAERAAYLDDACGQQPALRKELDELLAAQEKLGSFLARPPSVIERTAPEKTTAYEPIREGVGSTIGPYKLLQQIGEGGFGVVFMAEQTQPIRRMVALKIIKPGMDTAQVIARFESERQALALMEHPNIARVLDAGATESGRPYFVMELVKGIPITDVCDQNQLLPEARLRLFLDVCRAVQHAHHKGIIHRDLKPSNVLATLHDGVPVVKVIDFGVAKATGQKLTEKTLFTAFGQIIGTPAYMSPEQAEMSGLDIDTRSDVYSLGVLLYELLTGTTPVESRRLRQAGYAEMQRLIREEEPPRPSTRLSSLGESATVLAGNRGLDVRRLVQMLAGDLDWTVMKALDKDRNRRYDTPASFAEDIERCLRREPVLARPPSTLYKLRKFTQRNRTAVTASALVVASLLLGTALASWQAVRAVAAEGRAKVARSQAESDRDRAMDAEHRASDALQRFVDEKKRADVAAAETGVERGKNKDFLNRQVVLDALFSAMHAEHQGSYEMAEHCFRFALDNAQNELGFDGLQTYYATIALADFYSRRKTPEKAEESIRKLYDFDKLRHERTHTPKSDEKPVAPDQFDEAYVRALDLLGSNLLAQHKWTDAEAILRKDLTLREKLKLPVTLASVPANAQSMLGASLVGQKRYAEAEPLLQQGYRGLKDMANAAGVGWGFRDMAMPLLKQAAERLVQLYEAWGKPDKSAKWRKQLEAFKK